MKFTPLARKICLEKVVNSKNKSKMPKKLLTVTMANVKNIKQLIFSFRRVSAQHTERGDDVTRVDETVLVRLADVYREGRDLHHHRQGKDAGFHQSRSHSRLSVGKLKMLPYL